METPLKHTYTSACFPFHSLYNIATIHLELGNDEESLPYYRETLRVEQTALGATHKAVQETMTHLAQVHLQRGELDKALDYFSEVLSIQKKATKVDPIACAKTLNHIGNVYIQWGKTPELMEAMSESLRFFRQAGGSENDLTISSFNLYGLAKLHTECAPVA